MERRSGRGVAVVDGEVPPESPPKGDDAGVGGVNPVFQRHFVFHLLALSQNKSTFNFILTQIIINSTIFMKKISIFIMPSKYNQRFTMKYFFITCIFFYHKC